MNNKSQYGIKNDARGDMRANVALNIAQFENTLR